MEGRRVDELVSVDFSTFEVNSIILDVINNSKINQISNAISSQNNGRISDHQINKHRTVDNDDLEEMMFNISNLEEDNRLHLRHHQVQHQLKVELDLQRKGRGDQTGRGDRMSYMITISCA